MMPVIRLADRTWSRLKEYARPLEDSADDVVNRALDALDVARKAGIEPERQKKAPVTRKRGEKLPQREFREPLLAVLRSFGGKAASRDVREKIEPMLRDRLSDADYENVSTGEPRWWNATCWERNDMVKAGILKSDSPRGVWEIA